MSPKLRLMLATHRSVEILRGVVRENCKKDYRIADSEGNSVSFHKMLLQNVSPQFTYLDRYCSNVVNGYEELKLHTLRLSGLQSLYDLLYLGYTIVDERASRDLLDQLEVLQLDLIQERIEPQYDDPLPLPSSSQASRNDSTPYDGYDERGREEMDHESKRLRRNYSDYDGMMTGRRGEQEHYGLNKPFYDDDRRSYPGGWNGRQFHRRNSLDSEDVPSTSFGDEDSVKLSRSESKASLNTVRDDCSPEKRRKASSTKQCEDERYSNRYPSSQSSSSAAVSPSPSSSKDDDKDKKDYLADYGLVYQPRPVTRGLLRMLSEGDQDQATKEKDISPRKGSLRLYTASSAEPSTSLQGEKKDDESFDGGKKEMKRDPISSPDVYVLTSSDEETQASSKTTKSRSTAAKKKPVNPSDDEEDELPTRATKSSSTRGGKKKPPSDEDEDELLPTRATKSVAARGSKKKPVPPSDDEEDEMPTRATKSSSTRGSKKKPVPPSDEDEDDLPTRSTKSSKTSKKTPARGVKKEAASSSDCDDDDYDHENDYESEDDIDSDPPLRSKSTGKSAKPSAGARGAAKGLTEAEKKYNLIKLKEKAIRTIVKVVEKALPPINEFKKDSGYECFICTKICKAANWKRHILVKHYYQRFYCYKCGLFYAEKVHRDKHMETCEGSA